jgi:hypothetical protein
VAGEFDGYVVRRGGRATSFSKRTDAAALFRALRALGVPFRQAEDAVGALLGVDRGELARGLRAIESSGEEQDALAAVFAIGKHSATIRERLGSPDVNADAAIAALPVAAQSWLRGQLVHFSQGTP